MDSILQVFREVVRDELRRLYIGELGTVTSVFPIDNPEGSDNHACSVKLRDHDVELRKVPIATPHIGLVSCPQIGDLVLVTFIAGNPNDPVVIGRLHSEKTRPPKHEDGELVIQAPHDRNTRMQFKADGALVISTGDAECELSAEGDITVKGKNLTVEADGDITVSGTGALSLRVDGDATIEVQGNTTLETTDCVVNASGDIKLGEGGSGVITESSHKCYFTGAALVGSSSVTAK